VTRSQKRLDCSTPKSLPRTQKSSDADGEAERQRNGAGLTAFARGGKAQRTRFHKYAQVLRRRKNFHVYLHLAEGCQNLGSFRLVELTFHKTHLLLVGLCCEFRASGREKVVLR
jgi:hypothetical protein